MKVNAPEAITKVYIYAMNGAVVSTVAPASASATITTSTLAPGAYVVKVITPNKAEAQPILIK